MGKVTYEVLIVEELDDETDPQERADDIAYEISSILNYPLSVEVTVINPDTDVKKTSILSLRSRKARDLNNLKTNDMGLSSDIDFRIIQV
jgi:hypothetical protein